MRIVFLGTPEFAVPSLKQLIEGGHEVCVFTQPDRPKGRGLPLFSPPVKACAEQYGVPVYQAQNISDAESVHLIKELNPDLMVTAAWGQLLTKEVLKIPKQGCLNVHGSLLPKYRGASPIQWTLINGERETGVTIMLMDEHLDTGDLLSQQKTDIKEMETAGELFERLACIGGELLAKTLPELSNITPVPQDPAKATYCKKLTKKDGKIDFSQTSQAVCDRIRGVNPWPGAFSYVTDVQIKIWKGVVSAMENSGKRPGECVVADPKKGLFVATGDGVVEILELQYPGAKMMSAKAALLGHSLAGAIFS